MTKGNIESNQGFREGGKGFWTEVKMGPKAGLKDGVEKKRMENRRHGSERLKDNE